MCEEPLVSEPSDRYSTTATTFDVGEVSFVLALPFPFFCILGLYSREMIPRPPCGFGAAAKINPALSSGRGPCFKLLNCSFFMLSRRSFSLSSLFSCLFICLLALATFDSAAIPAPART